MEESSSPCRVVELLAFDHQELCSRPFTSREEAEDFVAKQQNTEVEYIIEPEE